MDSIVLVTGLVGLILIGAPVALAMLLLPTVYILVTDAAPILTIPHQMYEAVSKLPLVATTRYASGCRAKACSSTRLRPRPPTPRMNAP